MKCLFNRFDTRCFRLEISGTPKSQPRARLGKWGAYDPAKDKKNWVKWQIKNQIPEGPIITGPVGLHIWFYMPIPKSTSKKLLKEMLSEPYLHTKKPDLDNLEKFYKDAMTGMVYRDDSQVCYVEKVKLYSPTPRTIIDITTSVL